MVGSAVSLRLLRLPISSPLFHPAVEEAKS